jgi:hypothetical protein
VRRGRQQHRRSPDRRVGGHPRGGLPPPPRFNLTGSKPVAFADVRFGAHYGLRSDIARGPKSARARNRCAIARCAGSPTVSAVTGGKIVKTQIRCTLVRPLRRCGLSASMVVADRTVRNSAPEMQKAISASSRILNDGHRANRRSSDHLDE